ncbi:hypothetical protein PPSQR21_038490 [Paenibacillus polymyxa SQR-21]|uniref:hypothetical protein n=1 Tax=Paenibacillus polymyxa TaxID=1406 RepID=UPI00042E7F22|nr:hypothetical protein [Paenibacillus polymyxa]AHM67487.1 hypothetical protein PPSQR21_038490 [Paenibacillus polymyxa SQR-21]
MDQKEYLKKMVELRKKKSELLAYSREPWATKYFKKAVKEFTSSIPAKNSDLPKINSPEFEVLVFSSDVDYQILVARAEELKKEYKTSMAPIGSPKPVSEPKQSRLAKPVKNDSEGKQVALELRGGRRSNAGRKSIGEKKTVSIAMPYSEWSSVDTLIKGKVFKSQSDFFRSASIYYLKENGYMDRPEYLDFVHDNAELFKDFMETDLYKRLLEAKRK